MHSVERAASSYFLCLLFVWHVNNLSRVITRQRVDVSQSDNLWITSAIIAYA